MIYCLNPDCSRPHNSDGTDSCQSCGRILKDCLRNRYKITKAIGQGDFGKTYLTEDRDRLNQLCVVK